jgi:tetratricopeptide (TPR) repeat protein
MQSLEYIDNYFKGALSAEEITQFEKRILNDHAFAEEVAFYCNVMQAAKDQLTEERKQRFREIYSQRETASAGTVPVIRRMRPFIAAAAVIAALVFGWYLFMQQPSPNSMADEFIRKDLKDLPVQMGTTVDELEKGKDLYNKNRLQEAQQIFENISQKDTASTDAKKFAGLVSLRLGQYDKAIGYFTELENVQLYANPGKFYHALTLMKRNQPGDAQRAKQLLQQVVQQKLAYSDVARKWLDSW